MTTVKMTMQPNRLPLVPRIIATGSALIIGLNGQKAQEGTLRRILSLVNADNEFFLILSSVKLFHLDQNAILNVLIDNLVLLCAHVVNHEVLARIVEDLLVV